jgi:hypothetical protein
MAAEVELKEYWQHITDGPTFRLTGFMCISDVVVRTYGSRYGRIIFTEHSPMVVITGARNVVQNSAFIGGDYGIEVEVG